MLAYVSGTSVRGHWPSFTLLLFSSSATPATVTRCCRLCISVDPSGRKFWHTRWVGVCTVTLLVRINAALKWLTCSRFILKTVAVKWPKWAFFRLFAHFWVFPTLSEKWRGPVFTPLDVNPPQCSFRNYCQYSQLEALDSDDDKKLLFTLRS